MEEIEFNFHFHILPTYDKYSISVILKKKIYSADNNVNYLIYFIILNKCLIFVEKMSV